MSAHLNQVQREFNSILERIRGLEQLSVPAAAELLKKSKRFIRENFPIVIVGLKTHRVRLVDLEKFQERRTIWPQSNGSKKANRKT